MNIHKKFKDEMSTTDFCFCFMLKGGWAVVLCPNKTHFTWFNPSLLLVFSQG